MPVDRSEATEGEVVGPVEAAVLSGTLHPLRPVVLSLQILSYLSASLLIFLGRRLFAHQRLEDLVQILRFGLLVAVDLLD